MYIYICISWGYHVLELLTTVGGFNADERLASILLNLNVEPGPRCEGGFNSDFFPASGIAEESDVPVAVDDDGVVIFFCWEAVEDVLVTTDVAFVAAT